MAKGRAGTVNCCYGATGSTKTSRMGDAALYYYETTGKPSRLICTDNAGWGPLDSLVDEGIIIPFRVVNTRKYVIGTLSALTQGYWPKDIDDPHSDLVPPKDNGILDIGALILDGITNACSMMMQVHQEAVEMVGTEMKATTVKVPEMPRDSFVLSGPDFMRRFTGRSDYMGVQDRAVEFVRNLSMLPIPAELTALESKGEDGDKKPTYGPQFIGKALTGVCGPWFGNLIHLDFMTKQVEVDNPVGGGKIKIDQPTPIMFLRDHYDPKDAMPVRYPAKVRAPRTMFEKVPPMAEPRLDKLYHFLDRLREKEKEEQKKVTVAVTG